MADKPKITGLGFNLFAIVAVLILLPIGTSTITSLSSANSGEYISVNRKVEPDEGYYPDGSSKPFEDRKMFTWTDKGNNMTYEYLQSNPSSTISDYETIWDWDNAQTFTNCYNNWVLYCDQGLYGGLGGGVDYRFARNNDVFFKAYDNHNSLSLGNNYAGYIGYSGDEFSWHVHNNYMKYIPNSTDISKLKFTFIDQNNAYSCDTPIFQNILFKHDITFRLNYDSNTDYTLRNFESSKYTKYEVTYLPDGQTTTYLNGTSQPFGNICHIKFELEYEFTPFEIIEISERFNRDFQNMELFLRVYDIKAEYSNDVLIEGGLTYGSPTGQQAGTVYPLAFEGDQMHGILFEYSEVDTARTNFFLSGGTLILGLGLFLLAIASTQYWNPVIGFFKPDGA